MRTAPLFLLAALLVGFAVAPSASAADSPHDRSTLLGLTAVFVDVQPIDPAGLLAGLAQADIKSELETRIRLAGLRVIAGPKDDVPPQERGVMQVNVSVVPVPKQEGSYGWSVYLAILQGAVLIRDTQTILAAPTWWVARSGVGDVKQIKAGITEAADRFVTAFRAVEAAAPKK
jgi:hypothetical protein